jgi:hypothetical protein
MPKVLQTSTFFERGGFGPYLHARRAVIVLALNGSRPAYALEVGFLVLVGARALRRRGATTA